jgi:predicted ArsR family transcriptional regulator
MKELLPQDKVKVKNRILNLLKIRGAQTAIEIGENLEVSPIAIRQHLQVLLAEGWVHYIEEARPVGRPVKLWQLTQQAINLFPDSHADLVVKLIEGVSLVFGVDGLSKLIHERTQAQLKSYTAKITAQLKDKNNQDNWRFIATLLADIRTQEGYMAEVIEQADGKLLLVENHCSICTAAQNCSMLCTSELELFSSILGENVKIERTEHILQGDRRCAYLLQEHHS